MGGSAIWKLVQEAGNKFIAAQIETKVALILGAILAAITTFVPEAWWWLESQHAIYTTFTLNGCAWVGISALTAAFVYHGVTSTVLRFWPKPLYIRFRQMRWRGLIWKWMPNKTLKQYVPGTSWPYCPDHRLRLTVRGPAQHGTGDETLLNFHCPECDRNLSRPFTGTLPDVHTAADNEIERRLTAWNDGKYKRISAMEEDDITQRRWDKIMPPSDPPTGPPSGPTGPTCAADPPPTTPSGTGYLIAGEGQMISRPATIQATGTVTHNTASDPSVPEHPVVSVKTRAIAHEVIRMGFKDGNEQLRVAQSEVVKRMGSRRLMESDIVASLKYLIKEGYLAPSAATSHGPDTLYQITTDGLRRYKEQCKPDIYAEVEAVMTSEATKVNHRMIQLGREIIAKAFANGNEAGVVQEDAILKVACSVRWTHEDVRLALTDLVGKKMIQPLADARTADIAYMMTADGTWWFKKGS